MQSYGDINREVIKIRFAVSPLVDCSLPLILQSLDPTISYTLNRAFNLDIQIKVYPFDKLIPRLADGGADVAIASLVAAHTFNNSPEKPLTQQLNVVPTVPTLQLFNAYFLFAKRSAVTELLKEINSLHIELLHRTNKSSSFCSKLTNQKSQVILELVQSSIVYTEINADMRAALDTLLTSEKPSKINYYDHNPSIRSAFESFRDEESGFYLGGIAESAYCLNRCSSETSEYVLIAGPDDFQKSVNLNSFIFNKDFLDRHPEIKPRLANWWFTVVDWFNSVIVETTSSPNSEEYHWNPIKRDTLYGFLRDKEIQVNDGNTETLVPNYFSDEDINITITFLKGNEGWQNIIQDGGKSYMFKSYSDASEFVEEYNLDRFASTNLLQPSNTENASSEPTATQRSV